MCPVVLLQIIYENQRKGFEQTNVLSFKLKPRYSPTLNQNDSSYDIAIIS